MKGIKKQIPYFVITFVVAFLLGSLFGYYVLPRDIKEDNTEKDKKELNIVLQKDEVEKKKNKTLSVEEGCTIYVDVSGAIKSPGVYCLDEEALVIDAVNKGGGFSKDAGLKFIARRINLAQPLVNNQKLYFPFEKELVCELEPLTDEASKLSAMLNPPITELPTSEPFTEQNQSTPPPVSSSVTSNSANPQCVNINTATKEQLITLNGVGEVTAERIISGRPYATIEDLLNVSGIGEATLAKFKDEVCI